MPDEKKESEIVIKIRFDADNLLELVARIMELICRIKEDWERPIQSRSSRA